MAEGNKEMMNVAPSSLASGQSLTSAASCVSPPLGQTRLEVGKRASLVAGPGSTQNNAVVDRQTSELTTLPVVFYIDRQHLGRDCISVQLAIHLPEWAIKPIGSVLELQIDEDWPLASLVILRTHTTSIADSNVADEIAIIGNVMPGLPLVIMSELDDATEVLLAIELGACGYLPASLPLAQTVGAIRLVGAGGTYIPTCVLTASPAASRTSSPRAAGPIHFSPRQLQVLALLQQGKQNKIIAYELGMCESTVKVHIRHIMRKLNARNRTQVVMLTNNWGNRPARALAA
jgi:DNA-binding NarL/FixJ family response regulator